MTYTKHMPIFALLITMLALTGCLQSQTHRVEIAKRIAGPAQMIQRDLQAGDFSLRLFERVHNRGGVAHIYIEGDDVTTGIDPTPQKPVSLMLAAQDKADNVISIARPCQYKGRFSAFKQTTGENNSCSFEHSKTKRFAPEVIESYKTALDELKRRWGFTAFHLYGHSGGGAIAVLLASERKDILSLTTVAGLLDTESYSARLLEPVHSKHQGFEGSINPAERAMSIADIPQAHYIGSVDTVMPKEALNAFLNAMGRTNCAHVEVIEGATYTDGWTENWSEIAAKRQRCKGSPTIKQVKIAEPPEEPLSL